MTSSSGASTTVDDKPKIYTIAEAADVLRLSQYQIKSLIERRLIAAADANPGGKYRRYRITQEAIEAFLRENTTGKPTPARTPKARRSSRQTIERIV